MDHRENDINVYVEQLNTRMKPRLSSGFAPLLIIGAIAILLIVGAGAYYLGMQKNNPPSSNSAPSPTPEMVACTADAKMCPDGSAVGRVGPNCEFAPCPGSSAPGVPPEDTSYTCPQTDYVDCMPGPDKTLPSQCDPTFLKWAQTNCPGFKGGAF